MRVLHVAGARPNFMKVAPVIRALRDRGVENLLVHTGQHYDPGMSETFFADLGLPEPDVHLGVGSGSHAAQTARVMERIEPILERERPDLTLVAGDVNSTLAAALVCAKLHLPVGHVEAGLRSFDRDMPEEINRLLTDQVSDLLFTTSPEAAENLAREGIPPGRIHFVGNPMIDSVERHLARARERSRILDRFGLRAGGFGVVTLHRAANVDDPARLRGLLEALGEVAGRLPLIFPLHPRTAAAIRAGGLDGLVHLDAQRAEPGAVACVEPLGYLDFLRLLAEARLVLTDSGGIQEETTVLGVPCLTVRSNTERPITVRMGTNRLVGTDPEALRRAAREVLGHPPGPAARPPLWDGRAGERIAEVVVAALAAGEVRRRDARPAPSEAARP